MNEMNIKYLEIIQSVISRLANNSFLIKGWTISIAIAGLGVFETNKNPSFLWLIIFSSLIFWTLDGYYVRQERIFRKLFEDKAINDHNRKIINFSLNTENYEKQVSGRLVCMFSFPTSAVYLSILFMAFWLLNSSLFPRG
ncbi:hypothetical protein HY947_06325 [Candidatus Gottesmanbacteria bacterium]|nr:hypothetical protein [Candidatus Gottesmanbacteria bacterium]